MGSARCKADVPMSSGWGYSQCGYGAKYGDYCGVHSPEKQAARKKRRGPTQFEREVASINRRKAHLEIVETERDAAQAELAEAVALLRKVFPWLLRAEAGTERYLVDAFLSKHPEPSPTPGGESDEERTHNTGETQ